MCCCTGLLSNSFCRSFKFYICVGVCDSRMRAIIFEFPRSVCEFCGWGKYFNNEAWRLDCLNGSPVAWIAGNYHIRMKVACLRDVYFHVGTINATFAPTQKVPKDALDI